MARPGWFAACDEGLKDEAWAGQVPRGRLVRFTGHWCAARR